MEFYRKRKIESTIDMTPMIDTLLQIFVAFMLSMSFAASAVQLKLPQAAASDQKPALPAVVSLDAENRMFFNGEQVTPENLSSRLAPVFEQTGKREVVLRADQALPYKHVLKALHSLRQAGAADVHLAYEEEPKQ